MSAVIRLARLLAALLAGVLLLACGRGPEPGLVREAMQEQLDAALGERVLEIRRFRPAGGAPLRDPEGRLVYFNAQLELARDYDFTRWDAHSVATLAALLGAGPKGVIGLKAEGNAAGDAIGVYGSAAFARGGAGWRLLARSPDASSPEPSSGPAVDVAAVPPRAKEALPPAPLDLALAELEGLRRERPSPPVGAAERDAILLEETERAVRAVRQRLALAETRLTLAGGPPGGAYAEFAAALSARAAAAGLSLQVRASEGSIGNLRLLRERGAQFALAQNDLARTALEGRGRFSGAPQPGLRALASLFPEPIHLVATAKAGIGTVADLLGKRVNLGPEGSGTRANALAVLAAHGLSPDALEHAGELPLGDAAAALAAGRIDAMFGTIHAPARDFQRAAVRGSVVFVPIEPSPALVEAGLVPLTLPSRTYPGQAAPVPTLAATALLVTRDDVTDAQVDAMLALAFERSEGASTAAVSQIAPRTARQGVMIPWHPRAEAYLGGSRVRVSR